MTSAPGLAVVPAAEPTRRELPRGPRLDVPPPEHRERKGKRRPLSPRDIANAKVHKAKASAHDKTVRKRDAEQAAMIRLHVADVGQYLWVGGDYSRATGRLEGVGADLRVRCGNPDCGRLTPPNNVRDLYKATPFVPGRRSRYRLVGRNICDHCVEVARCRPDADERPKRTVLDKGSDEVIAPLTVTADVRVTTEAFAAVGERIGPTLSVGGKVHPEPPQFDAQMPADMRRSVLAEYQRQVAEAERDESRLAARLALYERRMAVEPNRQTEWLAEFDSGA